ncbi:MAG TPA: phosphoribosylaminoimidazolesuccinocarboxamide synthase [Dehalococcoidia bacterium]|jgi:phosphoribosylaminoimidazole-succinocarboxamide synthase|nr:phosphoribosylaminoimidazolesuccinocarboxamide synthase [SAR202 cluster bacterium]MDP6801093.1 phosphoribosylaminoimidazolesuccinocarboxamide synthase [SAR202 cluster bacterium]MQG59374.1 phosphoribosylaminoimidazolesuccinocarboxamide synthase [SAR202 cluster bacterium]HAL46472.1 phosphoribosylaminoimidazolesuccinocarboxamide synthase [Dehalococcoidia bacterium]|tara:strand:- start:1891 stop:2766 length:876 start_codon:yes stop_codon:yes gene_type:complete
MTAISETNLPNTFHRGKVRDTYNLTEGTLLMVATDRTSAFDVVLPTAIPEKGAVLCQISAFWFEKTADIIPNHFLDLALDRPELNVPPEIARRSMVVKKAERINVECVARGFITGSAWAEYRRSGTVQGNPMPEGMREGDPFPEVLFTPTTKAEVGHDENMSFAEVVDMVGAELANQLRDTTIALYSSARDFARSKGIIIADTKVEFGLIDGELTLIDELMTPDSSRFWDEIGYEPGKSQPNFDKQFVRDWLDASGWDHEPPAPELPDEIVEKTRQRYVEAFTRLTGMTLS